MKNRVKYILIISLIYTLPFSCFSTDNTQGVGSGNLIQKALDDFSRDGALRNASWGFYAINTSNGKEIASYNSDLALVPASTQKVVTTLTSLLILGNDYRFETLIQYDGIISDGTLEGNLYITGHGDPTLGSSMMHDTLSLNMVYSTWLKDLKASGINKISGNIIADGSWFDDHLVSPKWSWQDIGNYYGAGSHALTANENLYSVYFQPGRQIGHSAKIVSTLPIVPEMTFKNDVKTGPRGSGDRVYIYGSPYCNERWLTGTVPLGQSNFEVKGSLPDPGFFLAASFKEFLMQNNIIVNGETYTHRDAPQTVFSQSRVTISRRLSPTLEAITGRTNLHSVNTYAENLVKTLAKTQANEGSFEAGAKVIMDFWQSMEINIDGMRLHDGSGLSAENNITPKQLTSMLHFTAQDEALFKSFISGLPIANETGSLSGMFASTSSAGVLMAKSGFLGNVRAYAGYTRSRDGSLIAFTIIVNNYAQSPAAMRRKMEVLMDALTRSTFTE
jgi:serine-type D-Ala-D-Ala carboxypeptidase/endopeptidase (penicillin-binding protein 4)